MTRQDVNESMSIEQNGNYYCVLCDNIKDDSRDDCECAYENPRKHNE